MAQREIGKHKKRPAAGRIGETAGHVVADNKPAGGHLIKAGTGQDRQRGDGTHRASTPADQMRLHQQCRMHIGATAAEGCLLYTSPSPRDSSPSRMPSSA